MKKMDIAIGFILFSIGILLRLSFIESMQSHWDGPQYSIAIIRYSLEQQTPAIPGYPLYIGLGRLFHIFLQDTHKDLLIISVLFSGIGALIFFTCGKIIFNRIVGTISSLLFLSGSVFYFFGLTAYEYIITPSLTTLLAVVVFLIIFKKKSLGLVLGLLFSISLGFRPQEIFFILPLFIYGILHLSSKEKVFAIFSFIVVSISWFLPFLWIAGGLEKYIKLLSSFLPSSSLSSPSIIYLERSFKGFFLSFGLANVFLFFYLLNLNKLFKNRNKITFFLIWIIPCLIFTLFIRNDHAGYQMTYLSCFLILISYAIYRTFRNKRLILSTVVILCVLFNLYWFFKNRDPNYLFPYIPTSFHYSEIRKNDIRLSAKINFVKKEFNPTSTLIITSDQLWRPTMYYLDKYLVYDIPALATSDINFKYIKRESMYWDMREFKDKLLKFKVPKNIKTLVFVNDESYKWIKVKNIQIYNLAGNSRVTTLNVKRDDIVKYNYMYVDKE